MHRCSQKGRRGVEWRALEGLPPPCGQLTRCFSAVDELLVITVVKWIAVNHSASGGK